VAYDKVKPTYLRNNIQNSKKLQRPLYYLFESLYLAILCLFLSVDDLSTAYLSSLFQLTVISLDKYSTLHRDIRRMIVANVSILTDFAALRVRQNTAAYLHNS
jgi:hypothetical protein